MQEVEFASHAALAVTVLCWCKHLAVSCEQSENTVALSRYVLGMQG